MSHVLLCQGTARALPLQDASVSCCVTSPPYFGLRRYDCGPGELGLEATPDAYVAAMVQVFREVWRVLRPDGTLWLNMGDSYANSGQTGLNVYSETSTLGPQRNGLTPQNAAWQRSRPRQTLPPGMAAKNLLGMPWRVALALQADGWILRSDIIWSKPSAMPESVQDRPTRSHEYVFLFSKQARYFYDAEAVKEPHSRDWTGAIGANNLKRSPQSWETATGQHRHMSSHQGIVDAVPHPAGRNARTVWRIASEPFSGSHFATFPQALVRRCLLAGAPSQVCAACGAPWRREVERQLLREGYGQQSQDALGLLRPALSGKQSMVRLGKGRAGDTQTRDYGFTCTCTCSAGTQPATILDPFCGSGTTLLVARELGHHAIGLDLSYPYLHDIARERLGLTALKAWQEGAAPRQDRFDDLPLFAP